MATDVMRIETWTKEDHEGQVHIKKVKEIFGDWEKFYNENKLL